MRCTANPEATSTSPTTDSNAWRRVRRCANFLWRETLRSALSTPSALRIPAKKSIKMPLAIAIGPTTLGLIMVLERTLIASMWPKQFYHAAAMPNGRLTARTLTGWIIRTNDDWLLAEKVRHQCACPIPRCATPTNRPSTDCSCGRSGGVRARAWREFWTDPNVWI